MKFLQDCLYVIWALKWFIALTILIVIATALVSKIWETVNNKKRIERKNKIAKELGKKYTRNEVIKL